jgi:hypothetical protein
MMFSLFDAYSLLTAVLKVQKMKDVLIIKDAKSVLMMTSVYIKIPCVLGSNGIKSTKLTGF